MAQLSAAFAHRLNNELPPLWKIEPEWAGETAFIIGGGPSVKEQNLDLLRGRKIIVINTSYQRVPWADYLIFSDDTWWRRHREKVKIFCGKIVSASKIARGECIWRRVNRRKPPGMSNEPGTVTVNWTTMTAAIDMAAQLGVSRIVTLGLDGRGIETGRDKRGKPIVQTHHHEPHPSSNCMKNWKHQKSDLASFVGHLKMRGIELLNASPGSALGDLWPIVSLEQTI